MVLGHHRRQHVLGEAVVVLHRREDRLAADVVPRGRDDARLRVVLAQQRDDGLQLLLAHALRAAEQNRTGVFNLVEEELAEVLDVHAALARVRDGHKAAHLGLRDVLLHALDRADHVGELAHAARLDQDAIRMILVDHLAQRLAEVAHQRAADAAGVHLRHLDAGLLHKAAVNADLAEFVFNQNDLLAGKRLFKQFLDQRRLARAKKAGKNINFRHGKHLLMGLHLGLRENAWDAVPSPAKSLRFLAHPPDSKSILYTVFSENTRISAEKTKLVKLRSFSLFRCPRVKFAPRRFPSPPSPPPRRPPGRRACQTPWG